MSKLTQSFQHHPYFAASFCYDQTIVELLLSHHLVRSYPEESVLGDRVRVIDGRDLHRLCSAWDDRCMIRYKHAGCEQEVQAVRFFRLLESSQRRRVSLTSSMSFFQAAAASESAALVHSERSFPSDGHPEKTIGLLPTKVYPTNLGSDLNPPGRKSLQPQMPQKSRANSQLQY